MNGGLPSLVNKDMRDADELPVRVASFIVEIYRSSAAHLKKISPALAYNRKIHLLLS
jgi:hypothetical protein